MKTVKFYGFSIFFYKEDYIWDMEFYMNSWQPGF